MAILIFIFGLIFINLNLNQIIKFLFIITIVSILLLDNVLIYEVSIISNNIIDTIVIINKNLIIWFRLRFININPNININIAIDDPLNNIPTNKNINIKKLNFLNKLFIYITIKNNILDIIPKGFGLLYSESTFQLVV
jgi:hypothetical protein